MESVGVYIKRERELRGFTLDEISRATKISMRYLRALETDDYPSLPAEPFVKGFLRSYAQSIGLNPQEVMLVYEQSRNKGKSFEGEPLIEPSLHERQRPRVSKKLVMAIISMAIGIVILGVLSIQLMNKVKPEGLVVSRSGTDSPRLTSARPASEAEKPDGSSQSLEQRSSETLKKKAISQKLTILPMRWSPQAGWARAQGTQSLHGGEAKLVSRSPGENLILKVTALAGAWVGIRMDDLENDERLFMPSGDTRVWTAKERITLTLGNARGVELELNGKKIPVPAAEGNVLRNFVLTRDNIR